MKKQFEPQSAARFRSRGRERHQPREISNEIIDAFILAILSKFRMRSRWQLYASVSLKLRVPRAAVEASIDRLIATDRVILRHGALSLSKHRDEPPSGSQAAMKGRRLYYSRDVSHTHPEPKGFKSAKKRPTKKSVVRRKSARFDSEELAYEPAQKANPAPKTPSGLPIGTPPVPGKPSDLQKPVRDYSDVRSATGGPISPRPTPLKVLKPGETKRPGRQDIEPGDGSPLIAPCDIPVWFGTNRAPKDSKDLTKGFKNRRGNKVYHGRCIVHVPEGHRTGGAEPNWWEKIFGLGKGKKLRVLMREPLDEAAHWATLEKAFAPSRFEGEPILFFVHGYKNGFDEVATRTAQLGYDLGIRHLAFFSWPSHAKFTFYTRDQGSADGAIKPLSEYLWELAIRARATKKKLHVIAHSMGNRILMRALIRLLGRKTPNLEGLKLDTTIFAAPDAESADFIDSVSLIEPMAPSKTLYASQNDKALQGSTFLQGHRAGLIPPVTIAPRTDTVDVSEADLSLLGHGYVANMKQVITDIHAIVHHASPPEKRVTLRRSATVANEVYWKML